MADNEKYVFRLYTTGIPGSGYKGNKSYFLDSPYVYSGDISQDNPSSWHNIGDTIHESDVGSRPRDTNMSRDFTVRPKEQIGHNTKQDEDGETYIELPHRGLSVIGLSDPKYSLYRPNDILDTMLHNKDNNITINEQLLAALPESWEHELYEHLYNNDFDINKAPGGTEDMFHRGNRLFNNWKRTKGFAMLTPRDNFYGGSSDYDFGYKPSYYNLLKAISDTYVGTGTEGNGLILASIPESALYNVGNVASGKMRGQRDFPEELSVNMLKLNDVVGMGDPEPNRKDYSNDRDYNAAIKEYNRLKLFEEQDIAKDLPGDAFGSMLSRWLERVENKPHDVRENLAKDLIFTYFGIDPDKIISDETKKIIYNDLSSWHKNNVAHSNIINGIKELGQ